MPKQSYAYAVGNVRAREAALLTRADLEQLLAQPDTAAIAALLRDRGYGNPAAGQETLDALLRDRQERLWAYLLDLTPDRAVFDPFLYAGDVHNFKVLLKATLRDRDPEALLLPFGSLPVEPLRDAVRDARFDPLPEWLAPAAQEAYTVFLQTQDAQLADGILDVALSDAQLAAAEHSRVRLLQRYFSYTVFYRNVKVALRAARAGKSAAFLAQTLCFRDPAAEFLQREALRGEEAVLEFLTRYAAYDSAAAAEAYLKSPSELERFVDNRRLELARAEKYAVLGPEPLIGYLLAGLTELKDVRIIASGVSTGQEAGQIRERLRDLYG